MEYTKIISYRQWRNTFIKKGHSAIGYRGDESFHQVYEQARSFILEETDAAFQPEVRLTMLNFGKKNNSGLEKKLVQDLIDICKKHSIFRKNRVEDLKARIKNNDYHIPGKDVVDKWFPEDSEK